MKKLLFSAMMLSAAVALAQDKHQGKVGINTLPEATLDINPNGINGAETATTNEGILVPRLSKTRIANIDNALLKTGTLVFVNNTSYTPAVRNSKVDNISTQGFYYYDGSVWQPMQKTMPKFDYVVSADGSMLMQWMNKRIETIDMNQYPDMENVTIIEQYLLQGSKVKKFVIKDGVTTIGQSAFAGNPDMEIPTLPSSITTIEEYAFDGNTKIKEVNLPNAIKIERFAFFDNTSITSVNLPSITTIGDNAFSGNTSLASISLPNATTIGENAFSGNTSLTSVSLPNATTIGSGAFSGNTSLTSISLPNATTIGSGAFSGNTSLTSVSLPSATTIGNGAFSLNTALTSISLPNVVTMVNETFADNPSLAEIIIGQNITEMGYSDSFRGLPSSTIVTIQATNPPTLTRGLYDVVCTFRVPSASVAAYRAKWAGIVPANQIVGY